MEMGVNEICSETVPDAIYIANQQDKGDGPFDNTPMENRRNQYNKEVVDDQRRPKRLASTA